VPSDLEISSSDDDNNYRVCLNPNPKPYQPRVCQRKTVRNAAPQSSSSGSSVSSQDLEVSALGGEDEEEGAAAGGFSVLQCLAQGRDAPVSKTMMQEAKASADPAKRNSSSALR